MGTVSALVFWIGGTIAGFIHGNYSPISGTVSELGALGTKSHAFMTVVMYISGITGILFAISATMVCRQAGINMLPAISAVSIPLTTLWAAVFPMGTPQHAMTGPVVFVIYIGVIIPCLYGGAKDCKRYAYGRLSASCCFWGSFCALPRFSLITKGSYNVLHTWAGRYGLWPLTLNWQS